MGRLTFIDFDKKTPSNDKAYHIFKHIGKGIVDEKQLSRVRANYLSEIINTVTDQLYIPFKESNPKHKDAKRIFSNITNRDDQLNFLVDRIVGGDGVQKSTPAVVVEQAHDIIQPEIDMDDIQSKISAMVYSTVQSETRKIIESIPKNNGNKQDGINRSELEKMIASIVQETIKSNNLGQSNMEGVIEVETTKFDDSAPGDIDPDDIF